MTSASYVEKDVTVGDVSLHYQEWGDPSSPPIVMLHGFALSGHMFDEFADRMKDRYRLIALDQRGHGDSQWAKDGNYTRDAFAGDLKGFADALGLERFVLIGHSMGGMNAAHFTADNPGRVEALVLVDVGPEAASQGVENIKRFTQMPVEVDFEEYVERAHQFNPRRTIENIRERLRHRLKPTESGKWTWKFDERFRDPESGIQLGSTASNDENWNLFRRIAVPTLITRGEESDILTQEVAERTAREMENARVVVVKGAGHSVPGDSPEEFTEAVRNFLDEVKNGHARPGESARPMTTAVVEQVRSSRKRSGLLGFVAAGAALAIGAGVATYFLRRRRQKQQPIHRRAAARVPAYSRDDLESARQRAVELASELGQIGQARARQFSQRTRERDSRESVNRAAQQASELLDLLERQSIGLEETARERLQRARGRRRRQRLMHLQRRPGFFEQALGGAATAVDRAMGLEERGLRRARRKVGAWQR